MTGVVVFNFEEFITEFPEFNEKEESLVTALFNRATKFLDNTADSIICDTEIRKEVLYLLTAHFLELQNRGAGTVGSVASASEGDASASFSVMNSTVPFPWNQTQYGAEYWVLILPYLSGPWYFTGC